MRHHACPHDIRAGVVVVRILDHSGTFVNHRQHQRLYQPIRYLDLRRVGQISFVKVRDNIRDTARGLIRGQGLRQCGIQDAELRSDGV